jgi:hypothetical protein
MSELQVLLLRRQLRLRRRPQLRRHKRLEKLRNRLEGTRELGIGGPETDQRER